MIKDRRKRAEPQEVVGKPTPAITVPGPNTVVFN